MTRKKIYRNQLSLIRQRRLIRQKYVSKLLGHRSIDLISRYERGTKMPSLRTALKLAIIYNIEVRVMLNGYFEACRREVEKTRMGADRNSRSLSLAPQFANGYCSFEEKLKKADVTKNEIERAHRHTVDLVRQRSEMLDNKK